MREPPQGCFHGNQLLNKILFSFNEQKKFVELPIEAPVSSQEVSMPRIKGRSNLFDFTQNSLLIDL